jgi:hypothetical protein
MRWILYERQSSPSELEITCALQEESETVNQDAEEESHVHLYVRV